ncbi:hypothetical protein CFOLD11_08850 [Clostridium folliculivorans]|uniref:Uncharacterized protein n=1 Tax=Clostridium folliculivorans TaxID=2886038 RepID=A0A9W6D9E9_9CLOT|nr:hypothetical protein [Clostridium folliculivorans]GKU24059.1 hypothetical protein CFOLD11_08850 [Clostridium folliculivorans]
MAKRKSKAFTIDKDDLAYEEEMDMNGFIETEIVGTPVATFSFCEEASTSLINEEPSSISEDKSNNKIELNITNNNQDKNITPKSNRKNSLIDNRTLKSQPYGITPPIDGEAFTITRSFKFRVSTARLLNEIKAAHPDPNAYLSTVIDAAVRKYHDYIFKEGGNFL